MLLIILTFCLVAMTNAGSRVQQLPYTCNSNGKVSFVVSSDGNGTICGAVFSPYSLVSCRDGSHGVVIYGGAISQPPYVVAPIIPTQGIDFFGGLKCSQMSAAIDGCVDRSSNMGQYQSMLYLRNGLVC